MQDLIRKVLDHCGYTEEAANEDNLILCFLDYVNAGCFGNLTIDEAEEDIENGDITLKMMCLNLLKVR